MARARAEAEIKMKIVLAEEEAWMAVRAQREREDARRAREEVEAELALEQEEKQREFSASVNLVRAELAALGVCLAALGVPARVPLLGFTLSVHLSLSDGSDSCTLVSATGRKGSYWELSVQVLLS